MLRPLAYALMISTFAAFSAHSADYPLEWHWIVVTPDGQTNWKVDQGIAQVRLDSHKFEASMKDGDIVLNGTITGRNVAAIETLIGTDANPITFHGDILRDRSRLTDPSNGWGSDRISLHAAGGFYIGLFRLVRSDAAPGAKP